MKRKIGFILLTLLVCWLIFWIGSLTFCEVLTYRHGDEFNAILTEKYDEVNSCKVLRYSEGNVAEVYCVANQQSLGERVRFKYDKNTDFWHVLEYLGGWSKNGNADDVVFPYWWHFIYFG